MDTYDTPMAMHVLTDAAIKVARAADKPQKLFDGGGLHVLLHAFHKKSGIATPKEEVNLASRRYKELVKSLRRS